MSLTNHGNDDQINALTPPSEDTHSKIYNFVSKGLSIITLDASGVFSMLVRDPMDRRLHSWRELIAHSLDETINKVEGLTLEDLSKNENFSITFSEATLIAARTRQQEKLTILRNAVLNAALPNSPEADIQSIFLTMLEEFTPWHLRLLQFFSSSDWKSQLGKPNLTLQIDLPEQLAIVFPDVDGHVPFFTKLINDLSQNRLLVFPDIRPEQRGAFITVDEPEDGNYLTNLGTQFLKFVSDPLFESIGT